MSYNFKQWRNPKPMSYSIEQIKLSFNHLKAVLIVVAVLAASVFPWSYSMGGVKDLASVAVGLNPISFEINVSPARPRTIDPISITISGVWSSSCVPRNPVVRIDGKQIYIATSNTDRFCLAALSGWSEKIDVGRLPVGTYQILVSYTKNGVEQPVGSAKFDVLPCLNC
jgi:hypothetical protein